MPTDPTPPASADLLRLLVENRVEFVVVGGVAAVLQGASILPVDLDLCIPFSGENLSRLLPLLIRLDARFRAHPERAAGRDKDLRVLAELEATLRLRSGS